MFRNCPAPFSNNVLVIVFVIGLFLCVKKRFLLMCCALSSVCLNVSSSSKTPKER